MNSQDAKYMAARFMRDEALRMRDAARRGEWGWANGQPMSAEDRERLAMAFVDLHLSLSKRTWSLSAFKSEVRLAERFGKNPSPHNWSVGGAYDNEVCSRCGMIRHARHFESGTGWAIKMPGDEDFTVVGEKIPGCSPEGEE